MTKLNPRWKIRQAPPPDSVERLEGYTPLQQALLLSRGITTTKDANRFLQTNEEDLHDPFMFLGMELAVERIMKAVNDNEKLCIYADYDADGITGAALLATFFRDHDVDVNVYFPDRFKEGYGLNALALERLYHQGNQLIITVDCGIRGIDEIQRARSLGLDVIVTDHHISGEELPESVATINPNLPGDEYPTKELSGAGVAYKLAQAVSHQIAGSSNVNDYLDFVAIGTVADIVPLIGENRSIVQLGLQRLNDTKRPGLDALAQVAGVRLGEINASTIGFGLGPRINASGRLASAYQAFELLIEEDWERAQKLAERLDRLNKERQKYTENVVDKVEEVSPTKHDKIILSFDPEYHAGVVGLAASRISERYFRPAIIGKVGETRTRASARSIPGFHITDALEQLSDLLERFGGHAAAAGFTVANEQRQKFVDRLLEIADQSIDYEQLQPEITIDACIGFEGIDVDLMSFLDALEPYGNGNSQPLFCSMGVRVLAKRTVGREGAHLKLTLENQGRPFDAIAFRMGALAGDLPEKIDVAYHVERNNYLGYETLQLRVVDIRPMDVANDPARTIWV